VSTLTGAIALPDGTLVRGRGRSRPLPAGPDPEFGLYLGSPGRRWFSRAPVEPPAWPSEWLDWPDFRTPRDEAHAAARIVATYERARDGERVEVACHGGTGRTGTVMACMAILAGHPADDALAWVRAHYRPRAVETPGQKRWIRTFPTLIA
jgi:hypothetical protein